jgi:hypothetical protein
MEIFKASNPIEPYQLHITERETRVLERLAKCLYYASKGYAHISNILVGLKGVGKTTLYVNEEFL